MTHFQLSATLSGHDQDVRAVRAFSDSIIVSAARDKTVRLWSRLDTTNIFTEAKVFLGHTHFVNSVAILDATTEYPSGLIATGSSDKTINVWDPENPQDPIYSLIDHKDNVCTLAVTPSGYIVSGSWDKTAKIWKNWQVAYSLVGHSAAVWAILAIDDDVILTGSADKSIIKWKSGKCVQTMNGHTDCVRGLSILPDIGFVSCGNDSTVRIWTLSGQCIQELNGHTSFVYSVFVLSTGEIVSSGEDRSVKVWKDGICTQTILHPATSVWCVSGLPNGDIVSGASDFQIRIFSRAQERIADESTQKEFEDNLANHAIPANQIGDVQKDKLPGPEALLQSGNKEGQVLMIKSGNIVEAHQWSSANQAWTKVGEVVDAVGQSRKQLFNGKEYDYVFDVDIGEGVPPLKLPYNATDNPYQAAQEFIWTNELPQSYLDQIAEFINKNAKGINLDSGSSQYADPYTGASRYNPGNNINNSAVQSDLVRAVDPWTRPGTSTSSTISSKPTTSILPQKTYITFQQANLPAIFKKISQLNEELRTTESSDETLTNMEITALEKFINLLQKPSTGSDVSEASHKEITLIHKILTKWPAGYRFPGLDLLRLIILYSPTASLFKGKNGSIINLIVDAAQLTNWPTDGLPSKVQETNLMLALRAFANLFETREGSGLLREAASAILELISSTWSKSTNKNTRIALITVLLNYSVLYRENPDEEIILLLMANIVELLESETDPEVVFRAIVTVGTLITMNGAAKEAAAVFDVKNAVTVAAGKVKEPRIANIKGEVMRLI
ncbi:hypothetical protein G9A89_011345 [Geosiphon pyriformis]|nr:hypothetical protein G9A89_011345 [Geosiphon pyriformis]